MGRKHEFIYCEVMPVAMPVPSDAPMNRPLSESETKIERSPALSGALPTVVASSGTGQVMPDNSTAKWMRLLIIVTTCLALFMALTVIAHLLGLISHTLLLFSLGILMAYALEPLVRRVRYAGGKERPRWVGVAVVFAVLGGVGALGFGVLGKTLVREVVLLSHDQDQFKAGAMSQLGSLDAWLNGHGMPLNLKTYVNDPPPNVKQFEQAIAHKFFSAAGKFAASLVEGLLVVLIALYFLIYSKEMRRGVNRNLPAALLPYVEEWQNDVNRILGGFVRGQLVLALIMGAAAAGGCALIGVHFWLLIGGFVVFASLIPVIGPYIGAIPAVFSAALSPSHHSMFSPATRIILVLLLFVVINEAGSKILYPRLVGKALGLHEVLVLFVLLAGFEVGHLEGVLFAAPLTALAIVTATQLYRCWQGLPPASVAQAARAGGAEAKAGGTP